MHRKDWKKYQEKWKTKRAPTWWPQNEPWPPRRHSHLRRARPFFLRLVMGMALVFLTAIFACSGGMLLLGRLLGDENINTAPILFAPGLILLGFIAVSLIGWGLRRSTLSIDDMREASERIAEGDYDVQVAVRGPREIRSVARAFNSMAAQLKSLEESRRDLLTDITHELRTPLAIIQGTLEGMIDGVYPRDETHLRNTLEEIHQLSHLVEDLHLLALLDSGALKFHKEPTDLLAFTSETVRLYRPQTEQAGISLNLESKNELPTVNIDPVRLREILSNLLVNALRHSESGGDITIQLEKLNESMISISIKDIGSGIPPQELPHVFDRFSKSTDSSGSGLGLAIVKSLVEAQGGQIEIDSTLGQGTTVSFTLPVETEL